MKYINFRRPTSGATLLYMHLRWCGTVALRRMVSTTEKYEPYWGHGEHEFTEVPKKSHVWNSSTGIAAANGSTSLWHRETEKNTAQRKQESQRSNAAVNTNFAAEATRGRTGAARALSFEGKLLSKPAVSHQKYFGRSPLVSPRVHFRCACAGSLPWKRFITHMLRAVVNTVVFIQQWRETDIPY